MSEMFSAPKVQILRIVEKFLGNCPEAESSIEECMTEMAEVVAGVVCFADYLTRAGTCSEEAARLSTQAQEVAARRAVVRRRERALRKLKVRTGSTVG